MFVLLLFRPISPRNRYIMCRPNPVNPIFMKPYDRTLTLFAILAPDDNQPKIGRVAIYKLRSRGGQISNSHSMKMDICSLLLFTGHSTKDLVFQRYEEVDDTRVYVVRYLKWSECCMYPLGFVESSFDAGDFQKYLCLEYRVRTGHKYVGISFCLCLSFLRTMIAIQVITRQQGYSVNNLCSVSRCTLCNVHYLPLPSVVHWFGNQFISTTATCFNTKTVMAKYD